MTISASSSAAAALPQPTSTSPPANETSPDGNGAGTVTPLQLALGAIILGASAGLTLYTKRTSTMLNQLERASKNASIRRGPPKYGPKTRTEYERTRNRWEKDD
mmetsp:Transcript_90/g.193  ORF Transcript_90/g.193 Transcript_90/m.193 type:complete len:104 (+) Transcript_90:237-548(+)